MRVAFYDKWSSNFNNIKYITGPYVYIIIEFLCQLNFMYLTL